MKLERWQQIDKLLGEALERFVGRSVGGRIYDCVNRRRSPARRFTKSQIRPQRNALIGEAFDKNALQLECYGS